MPGPPAHVAAGMAANPGVATQPCGAPVGFAPQDNSLLQQLIREGQQVMRMQNATLQGPVRLFMDRPPMLRHDPVQVPALQREMPKVGCDMDEWNVEQCRSGLRCEYGPRCKNYHDPRERRCRSFALSKRCDVPNCNAGLHIHWRHISASLTVDLEQADEVMQRVQNLEHSTNEERARYARLVAYGFARLHTTLLARLLENLPLVHELVLPDRSAEDNLLVTILDFAEQVTTRCPRLHQVVFQDGTSEPLWT